MTVQQRKKTALADKINPIRETDEEAIELARKLVSESRYAALGVRELETGVPLVIPAQQAVPAHLVDPKAKTRSRLHYQMAALQAGRLGGGWPVLVDPDGFLTEGTGWNVFLVRDGVLLSPEPRNILLGVSRRVTIELAQQLGIEVRETNLGRLDALRADEMFCTATTFALVHAHSFEGQSIGDGQPGPVFRRLQSAWKELAGVDFVAQAVSYAQRLDAWREQDAQKCRDADSNS